MCFLGANVGEIIEKTSKQKKKMHMVPDTKKGFERKRHEKEQGETSRRLFFFQSIEQTPLFLHVVSFSRFRLFAMLVHVEYLN